MSRPAKAALDVKPVPQPTPAQIKATREALGYSQAEAAALVYRKSKSSWVHFEADPSLSSHRAIPLDTWAWFLHVTDPGGEFTLP